MNDERKLTDEEITRRLGGLQREMPTDGELWSSIERAIREEAKPKDSIDARLAELAAATEPAVDLWPAIAARIRAERGAGSANTGKGWQTATLLAACLALFAVGIFFLRGPQRLDESPLSPPELVVDGLFAQPASEDSALAGSVYRDHIAMVRDQRETIEQAMQQYPNDTALRSLWRHAYETELRLIDEAGRVITNI